MSVFLERLLVPHGAFISCASKTMLTPGHNFAPNPFSWQSHNRGAADTKSRQVAEVN